MHFFKTTSFLLALFPLLLTADEPICCSTLPVGGETALALDYFRSLPDGSWNGNSGGFASLNLAIGLPKEISQCGLQLGASYGLYDWDGRGSNTTGNTTALQQQGFITLGLFRTTPHCSGINAAIVYDLMLNKQFGVFGLNPIIGQVRGQIGYTIREKNEVGLWGSLNALTAHKESSEVPVEFRAISQANLFWTHHFNERANFSLWVGTPYRKGLFYSSGRAGNYLFGAHFIAPLTEKLSLFGNGSYMGSRGPFACRNYASNVCFGITYAFGSSKINQRPYLALANNSNFLVDTNTNE